MKCLRCCHCNVRLNSGLSRGFAVRIFDERFFGVLTNYLRDHYLIKSDTNRYTVAKLRINEMSLEYPSHWCLLILLSTVPSSQPCNLVGKFIGAIQPATLLCALNSADHLINLWWSVEYIVYYSRLTTLFWV